MLKNPLNHDHVYLWCEIADMIPISESTWKNGVRERRYPQPIKLSGNRNGWIKDDIHFLLDYILNNGLPPANFDWEEYKASV
jgi:predicted DNA-binding transcriptional regulator AlpA